MNQIDILSAMAGVAVVEVAAREAMITDSSLTLYRCTFCNSI